MDADETRRFFKSDHSGEVAVGDKIRAVKGELLGAQGIVQGLEGENQVVFKPTNLEGFEDNLCIDKTFVIKYFE